MDGKKGTYIEEKDKSKAAGLNCTNIEIDKCIG